MYNRMEGGIVLSLRIELLDEKAGRPTGNPFKVRAVSEEEIGPTVLDVGTGLVLILPVEMKLDVTSLRKDVVFLSYRFASSGELRLVVQHDGSLSGDDEMLALVYVVEKKTVSVRFIESKGDKRLITGPPMDAKPEE